MRVETLVSDVEKVIENLRKARGEFNLAMLHSETEGVQTGWNLIVSAPWTDKLGLGQATRAVVKALGQNLGLENQSAVSRVTVLKTSDPFVREMNALFQVSAPGSRQEIDHVAPDGIPVARGILFYSQSKDPVDVPTSS
jgi:hypothetical protein